MSSSTGLMISVISGYVLAAAAPWLLRALGWKAGLVISALPLALAVFFVTLLPGILAGEAIFVSLPWVPSLGIAFSFYADGLSLLFAMLISGMGFLVFFYSSSYLKGHPHQGRFYMYMLIFMASMLGIVLSSNLFSLFVFWELTSISSFLLIGFNHEAGKSRYAALQALLVTSVGGLALMTAAVMIGMVTRSTELPQILAQGEDILSSGLYLPILSLVLLAAFTKSAQFPFHFWLPNAMEAPTPVSAYLHSATMVKAGIYLLARLSPAIAGTEAWTYTVTGVGAATMVVGAFLALNHWDKKRILAYSTISGLGMLTMLLGLGTDMAVKAMLAFLVAHALYKGALFLVAGAVEHETGSRNVNVLRGLGRAMPVTAAAAMVAGLSLAGLPPMLGFIAKEQLLEAARHGFAAPAITALTVISSGALATVAYIVAARPFVGKEAIAPRSPHEPPPVLWVGPAVLAGASLWLGLAPGAVNGVLSSAASSVKGMALSMDLALWHGFTPELALSAAAIGIGIAIYFAHENLKLAWAKMRGVANSIAPERLYRMSIDGMLRVAGFQTRVLQSGYLRNYVMTVVVTTVVLVGYAIVRSDLDRLPVFAGSPSFTEYVIAAVMLVAALTAVRLSSFLSAIVAMGIVGYGVAIIYILFGAPDLAMTQLVVETLTVVLFILGFRQLPREARLLGHTARTSGIVVALASGALVTVLMLLVSSAHSPSVLSPYFAENSYILAHGRNVVNVILVDFRALDTLGEATVLAAAGIGVFSLLKIRLKKKARP